MKYKVYTTTGASDTNFKVQKMAGGDDVTSFGTCSTANSRQLFTRSCNGGADLANDTRFYFKNAPTSCYLPSTPPNPLGPQEYFVFNTVQFSNQIAGLATKRRLDITVYFRCTGLCTESTQSKMFVLQSP
jgi:hypothetical protein